MNLHIWYSCTQTLSKVIAKLCDAAGIPGQHSKDSLQSTAATHLFEENVSEHQILSLTGHYSVAVHNYQRISADKKVEQSNMLYGQKCKLPPAATVTKAEYNPDFDISGATQVLENKEQKSEKPFIEGEVVVNYQPANVTLKKPRINIQQNEIVVEPVINLQVKDLVMKNNGQIVIPLVKVTLTININ